MILLSRSLFETDPWLQPENLGMGLSSISPLDVFDPFDELDRLMSKNLNWLNVPQFMQTMAPVEPLFPRKFRVSADISGFTPNSIKTEISDDKKRLIISGKEGEEKKTEENYSLREFRKSYNLPEKNICF